jgi:hypothetical protein
MVKLAHHVMPVKADHYVPSLSQPVRTRVVKVVQWSVVQVNIGPVGWWELRMAQIPGLDWVI